MSDYQNWLFNQKERIATLTLNHPEHSNNLTLETFQELRDITDHLRANKEIWAVILEGKGKYFSVGADVNIIRSMVDYPQGPFRKTLLDMQNCLDEFEALEKPTIAKIRGFCLGGGMVLALCCNFRIASQRTVLGFPEVKIGVPVIMGTQRVTRIAGVAMTKELILLGRNFNARTAKEYGLVHKVVPPDELDTAVARFASKFLKLPPRTVGAAKRVIDVGSYLPLRASQDLEIDVQAELLHSPDFKEAANSYIEGRPPRFIGE
jgi:enoyl-CoA hydratase/carnithine racemase